MRALLVLLSLISLVACENSGTEIDNPGVKSDVTLRFTSSSSASAKSASLSSPDLSPYAVASITMCIRRIRFKRAEMELNGFDDLEEDVDIEAGRVTVAQGGEDFRIVEVPAGTYERIEFDIEKNCDGEDSPSFIVDNDNDGGVPFETDDGITIKFHGLTSIGAKKTLSLSLASLFAAVEGVTSGEQIEDRVEEVSEDGEFEEDEEDEDEESDED